jgi:hypothetical protein
MTTKTDSKVTSAHALAPAHGPGGRAGSRGTEQRTFTDPLARSAFGSDPGR